MSEIAPVTRAYAEAVRLKDPAALSDLYAETALIFDMWGAWSHTGRAAWRESVEGWLGSLEEGSTVQVTFEPVHEEVRGDHALWCGWVDYADVGPDGAVAKAMRNRFTWHLVRSDSEVGWTITHEHSSAPADPQTGKLILSMD